MLRKIWKNKFTILEGWWRILFPKHKEVIKWRNKICRECVHYDKNGISENAVIKGIPACDICG